ncbi:MAG: acyl-CoA dehydrogenase family protein [Thermoplasmata archaeon]
MNDLLENFESVLKSQDKRLLGFEKEGDISRDLWKKLGEQRFPGVIVKKEYNGLNESLERFADFVKVISKYSPSLGLAFGIHAGLCAYIIQEYGSEEQKGLLPDLSMGNKIFAFAMTEENAGSDINGIQTTYEKKEGGYTISGKKIFISNAHNADYFITIARSSDKKDLSAFIVDSKKTVVSDRYSMMGMDALYVADVVFDQVDNNSLIGNEGEGARIALSGLDIARIGVAAQAVGIAESSFDYAMRYSLSRKQFGQSIADIKPISFYLSEMYSLIYIARMVYARAANTADSKERTVNSSIAKWFCTEKSKEVVDKAMQVVGGRAYLNNSPLERYMRDIKITEIYEGTNEIQKLVVYNNLRKAYQKYLFPEGGK